MLHWCFSWDLNVWSSYIRGGFGFQDALGYTQLDPNSVSVLFPQIHVLQVAKLRTTENNTTILNLCSNQRYTGWKTKNHRKKTQRK